MMDVYIPRSSMLFRGSRERGEALLRNRVGVNRRMEDEGMRGRNHCIRGRRGKLISLQTEKKKLRKGPHPVVSVHEIVDAVHGSLVPIARVKAVGLVRS